MNHPGVGDCDLSVSPQSVRAVPPWPRNSRIVFARSFPRHRQRGPWLWLDGVYRPGHAELRGGVQREASRLGPSSANRSGRDTGAHGEPVDEGADGEIHIRGPIVMLEYWRLPKETKEAILPGRWLRTGDIGRLEEGHLVINSRARDLILRGSENIYPAEIENRLIAHPDVSEAAVVGVEHEELGQEVKAIVVPRPKQLLRKSGRLGRGNPRLFQGSHAVGNPHPALASKRGRQGHEAFVEPKRRQPVQRGLSSRLLYIVFTLFLPPTDDL